MDKSVPVARKEYAGSGFHGAFKNGDRETSFGGKIREQRRNMVVLAQRRIPAQPVQCAKVKTSGFLHRQRIQQGQKLRNRVTGVFIVSVAAGKRGNGDVCAGFCRQYGFPPPPDG